MWFTDARNIKRLKFLKENVNKLQRPYLNYHLAYFKPQGNCAMLVIIFVISIVIFSTFTKLEHIIIYTCVYFHYILDYVIFETLIVAKTLYLIGICQLNKSFDLIETFE